MSNRIKTSSVIALAALFLCLPFHVIAIPSFLESWRNLYPNSSSGERNCQLCHVQESGDEPWNSYGFEIRDAYLTLFGSTDIDAAIEFVEDSDSDRDPQSLSNLQEIELGLDPGWAPGPINIWIYKNGDAIGGKLPPFAELSTTEETCFPIIAKNRAVTLVCL